MAGDASMFASRPPKRGSPRLALLGAVALFAGGGVWLARGPLRRSRRTGGHRIAAVGNEAAAAGNPPADSDVAAARAGRSPRGGLG